MGTLYSIKYLVSDTIKLPSNYNNIFTQKIQREFVIHDSYENRSEVSVFSKDGMSLVKLDGDNTRVIEGEKNPLALKYINEIRGTYQYLLKHKKLIE